MKYNRRISTKNFIWSSYDAAKMNHLENLADRLASRLASADKKTAGPLFDPYYIFLKKLGGKFGIISMEETGYVPFILHNPPFKDLFNVYSSVLIRLFSKDGPLRRRQ